MSNMSETVILSAIDRAIEAAKARKAAKEAAGLEPEATLTPKTKTPRINVIDSARAERAAAKAAARPVTKLLKTAQLEAMRLERRIAREEVKKLARAAALETNLLKAAQLDAFRLERLHRRDGIRRARDAARGAAIPAHLKKVERAKAKLPQLNEMMQTLVNNIVSSCSLQQIDALAMHMQLHARAEKTRLAATSGALPIGAAVTIFGGDPRYIGKVGRVVTSQKLRATVAVDGVKKPAYIYTSEAKVNI